MTAKARRQKISFIIYAAITMLLVLAALLLLTEVSRKRIDTLLNKEFETRVEDAATTASKNIADEILTYQDKLSYVAEVEAIKSENPSVCNPKLESLYNTFGTTLGNLGRINSQGIFFCSVNKQLIGVKGSTFGQYVDDIFQDPEHKPVLSYAIKPAGSTDYLLAIHIAVKGLDGKFAGTLGGGISINKLGDKYLKNVKPSENGFLSMVDEDKTILMHPQEEFLGKKISDPEVSKYFEDNPEILKSLDKAIAGEKVSIRYRAGGEERYATYVPVEVLPGRYIVVSAVVPLSDITALRKSLGQDSSILSIGIFFAILLLIISVSLLVYLNRKVFNPAEGMAKAAEAIRNGNMDIKVPERGGYELRSMANAINDMVTKLRTSNQELESKVIEKTKQIEDSLRESVSKNEELQNAQLRIINVLEDLSDQKAKLEASKNKDEAILSSIGDGVFAINTEGKIILFNKVAEQLSGISEAEAMGSNYADVLRFEFESTHEINDMFIKEALEGKKSKMANHTVLVRNDGTKISVADSAAPIMNSIKEIIGVIVVFRDVTKEHELERAKDEFTALASHQLRTPATAVKQYIGMILEGYNGDITEEQRETLKQAYASNERQLRIAEDLLSTAKLESDELELDKESVDLRELIQSVVDEQQEILKLRKQKLEVEMPDEATMVTVDHVRFRMVIDNLISNASKYTPEEGSLFVSLVKENDKAILSVKDHGVGIAENDIPKLFAKFSRIPNKLSTKVGGSGLGLYIAKQIVEKHNGTIKVESKLDEGTTFTIELDVNKE